MTRNPTLILGLGHTGGLVARELQTLLAPSPEDRDIRYLILGSPPSDEGDLASLVFEAVRNLEEIPLSMDLLRETMAGIRDWAAQLPWLARFEESTFLDEIRPLGAAGYRSFARLAVLRSDHLIDQALRRAISHLRQNSISDTLDVYLLAGAGGGLGSALLADLTYLIQRHARKSARTVCLVLPPGGESGRSRFDANAFATLCEIANLKAMRFRHEIRFETLPPIDLRQQGDEPWQRVYLFDSPAGDETPFVSAAQKAAQVLALQLQPRIARLRRQLAQDFTSVFVAPAPRPARLEKAFSACGGLTFDFPGDLPGLVGEDPITQPMLDRAWIEFLIAYDADLLAQRDDPVYETRKGELIKKHTPLWEREEVLVETIGPLPEPVPDTVPEKQPPLWIDPNLNFLRQLIGMEEAFASIHRDLKEAPPVLPVARPLPPPPDRKPLSLREHLEDLTSLRAQSGTIWPQHPPAKELADLKKVRRQIFFTSLRRNMVWNLTERFAVLQAIVRTPEFRDAFDRGVRAIAHEWLDYDPNRAVSPPPSFEEWLTQIEARLRDADLNLFRSSHSQPERGAFAIVLLPAMLPPGIDRDTLRERLENAIRTGLQTQARFLEDSGLQIRIYFEDLFHCGCDILKMPLYRKAYLDAPIKELFHTDYRFVTDHLCGGFCEADDLSPVYCGNPGCEADLRRVPPSVRICPACNRPIRSRCGNPKCRVRDLHLRPEANARTCPGCNGLNQAAWWVCCEHGKVATLVPVDKDRCPECIQQHNDDPIRFPASRISVRPDLRKNRPCWHCVDLAAKNPDHPVFMIPEDLYPFVHNGVNGHDRLRFTELAAKYKLGDGYCCPSCGTPLVPVDHRKHQNERNL